MKYSKKLQSNVGIIRIEGPIMGILNTEEFSDIISDSINKNGIFNFVFDLSKATWMNSSGLGLLISALTTARKNNGDVRLANVSQRIRRPIELTKLDDVFYIFNSIHEAVASYN